MLKISYAGCRSSEFGAIRSDCVSQPEIAQKFNKTPILAIKVIQILLLPNWKQAYDLLVNYINLGPILHRFWDRVTWLHKLANSPYPHFIQHFAQNDFFQIFGKT